MGREYAICAIDQMTEVHPGLGEDLIVGGKGDDQIVIEEASNGLSRPWIAPYSPIWSSRWKTRS
jgi:hypothetical protein